MHHHPRQRRHQATRPARLCARCSETEALQREGEQELRNQALHGVHHNHGGATEVVRQDEHRWVSAAALLHEEDREGDTEPHPARSRQCRRGVELVAGSVCMRPCGCAASRRALRCPTRVRRRPDASCAQRHAATCHGQMRSPPATRLRIEPKWQPRNGARRSPRREANATAPPATCERRHSGSVPRPSPITSLSAPRVGSAHGARRAPGAATGRSRGTQHGQI